MATTRTSTGSRALALAVMIATTLAADAAGAVKVEVDTRKLGPRIPAHFLGFSSEFELARPFLSIPQTGRPNPVFVQMARNLAAFGGGAPVMRIGGGSTDLFWYDDGVNQPGFGDFFPVDDSWLADIRSYIVATGSPLIMGVNLARNDPLEAATWGKAVLKTFGRRRVKALEVGNEPDQYPIRVSDPEYPDRMTRGKFYGPSQWLREFYEYGRAMNKRTPGIPLAGPAGVGYPEWIERLPQLIQNQRRRLSLVTFHRYATLACGKKPGTTRKVNPRELMAPAAVDGQFEVVYTAVYAAARYGKRVRNTESNSVACGGADGVSNAFASGIWSVDWLFLMALAGAEGVDFHTSSLLYQPFEPVFTADGGHAVKVNPLYYGMLLFAEASSNRSYLLPSSLENSAVDFRTWATYDKVDRVVRAAIVNKSGRPQRARIAVRNAGRKATLKRLTGASLSAKRVKLGGRRYPPISVSGRLPGPPLLERVRRRDGRFTVRMPSYGVALLTVPVRR